MPSFFTTFSGDSSIFSYVVKRRSQLRHLRRRRMTNCWLARESITLVSSCRQNGHIMIVRSRVLGPVLNVASKWLDSYFHSEFEHVSNSVRKYEFEATHRADCHESIKNTSDVHFQPRIRYPPATQLTRGQNPHLRIFRKLNPAHAMNIQPPLCSLKQVSFKK